VIGAVLGDPARSDRERTDAQIRGAGAKERPTIGRRQVGDPRRQDHPIGDAGAGREQLPEAGGLAADLGGVGHAHVAEPSDRRRVHPAPLDGPVAMARLSTHSRSSAVSSTDEPR